MEKWHVVICMTLKLLFKILSSYISEALWRKRLKIWRVVKKMLLSLIRRQNISYKIWWLVFFKFSLDDHCSGVLRISNKSQPQNQSLTFILKKTLLPESRVLYRQPKPFTRNNTLSMDKLTRTEIVDILENVKTD